MIRDIYNFDRAVDRAASCVQIPDYTHAHIVRCLGALTGYPPRLHQPGWVSYRRIEGMFDIMSKDDEIAVIANEPFLQRIQQRRKNDSSLLSCFFACQFAEIYQPRISPLVKGVCVTQIVLTLLGAAKSYFFGSQMNLSALMIIGSVILLCAGILVREVDLNKEREYRRDIEIVEEYGLETFIEAMRMSQEFFKEKGGTEIPHLNQRIENMKRRANYNKANMIA